MRGANKYVFTAEMLLPERLPKVLIHCNKFNFYFSVMVEGVEPPLNVFGKC